MLVEEWMTIRTRTVKPHDSIAHARALLEEFRINQVPVTVNLRLVGIVTDRDLRDAVNTANTATAEVSGKRAVRIEGPDTISVESVMSAKPITVRPKDLMEKAAELMRRERIGALPVVEGRTLRGILTRSDVLAAFVSAMATQTEGKGTNARKRANPKPEPPRHARRQKPRSRP